MRQPPNEKAAPVCIRGGSQEKIGFGSAIEQETKPSLSPSQAAIFTPRPRGTRWSVAAISPIGEAVKLGNFHHRREALSAAAIMADACGGRWLP